MSNCQSILTICIPTYNRGQLLVQSLQKMIPVCNEYHIQICVSDNASPDDTPAVMTEFVEKYPFIHYYRHQDNIGPDDNFEYVLKMATTKYRWLMSDTTYVTDIKDLMTDLSSTDYDGYVVNGDSYRAKHLPKRKEVYHDSISLMREVGWHMTWISCMIYNERLVNNMNFDRYKDSCFNQTALMFETTANRAAEFCFNPDIIVDNLPVLKDSGWMYHEFDIIFRKWYLLVMSLPIYYPYEIKKKVVVDSVAYPAVLNRSWHIRRRINGMWCAKDVYRNRFFVKQAEGNYLFFLIVGLCPISLLKIIRLFRHALIICNTKLFNRYR